MFEINQYVSHYITENIVSKMQEQKGVTRKKTTLIMEAAQTT